MSRARLRPLGFAVCGLLCACSSSPPTHYYTLNEIAPAGTPPAAASGVPVRVEPVAIPGELDRLGLVSHNGPNLVHISDSDRWAEPLDELIRRTLSDDLRARLPAGLIADSNEPATGEPRRLLSIAIVEFYGDENCAVTLRASWTLRTAKAGSQHGSTEVQVPPSAACGAALPAAMSRALGMLADQLVQPITGT